MSNDLTLFRRFDESIPRGDFGDLSSRTYEFDCGGSRPLPTKGANATLCRRPMIPPSAFTGYGCSHSRGVSGIRLTYVDSPWWSTLCNLTYFPADHFSGGYPGVSPTHRSSHTAYNNTFFSYSLPRDRQLPRSVGEPGGQFAPMLPDLADRCVSPPARGYIHPCWPKVAPKLSLRRPSSLGSGFSLQPQQEGRANDVLLSPPQRHLLSMSAVPLNRFKVHGPWASFIRLALRSSIDSGGCVPPPDVGAGATPCRGLEVLPTTTVWHGYTTTIGGSIARVTHAGIPFYHTNSWCPPCFLVDHIICGLFGGPSKRGEVLLSPPHRHLLPIVAVPLNRFKVHGPWASFIRLALRSNIDLGGCAPPPTVDAGTAPCRGPEALPTTMVWYGYTTTNSGSIGRLTHADIPFYRTNSWCPPYFLANHIIRGLF